MSKKLDYVRFDVGHYLHVCHKGTISKFPNCVLNKMIAPEFDKRQTENDYITVCRDGKHFGSILNYMRDPSSLHLNDWNPSDLTDLMREADYYCLTELVESCDKEFQTREILSEQSSTNESAPQVPSNSKLEIIFGLRTMLNLLVNSRKPTIVISYTSMHKFHIDSWIEELVRLCDYNKFNVYCFSYKHRETQTFEDLNNFLFTLYKDRQFLRPFTVPSYEIFRAKRSSYKVKLFKFWLFLQSNLDDYCKKLTKRSELVATM